MFHLRFGFEIKITVAKIIHFPKTAKPDGCNSNGHITPQA
jgi:hypothetical protein